MESTDLLKKAADDQWRHTHLHKALFEVRAALARTPNGHQDREALESMEKELSAMDKRLKDHLEGKEADHA
jgi:hypothetical protein